MLLVVLLLQLMESIVLNQVSKDQEQ